MRKRTELFYLFVRFSRLCIFLNVVRFSRLGVIPIILIVVSFIFGSKLVSVLGPKTVWILGLKNVNF